MNETRGNEPGEGRVTPVPAERIRRSPFQVRREEAPDPELVASVATHGLINPVTVRAVADGWELIAGHRRLAAWRAARPGEPVPAVVIEADDMTAEDLLVSENFFRKDLTLMEEAESVAQLRAHGRTVEQVATVVRKSERWVYRRLAVGGIADPWRVFLHAWRATYDEAARIARLPAAVQTAAWAAMLDDVADHCDYRVRKGNGDDARHREAFLAALAAAAGDKAAFCETMSKGSPDGVCDEPEDAEAHVRGWLGNGLHRFLRTQRLVSPGFCEFDCASCAGCTRRSDVAPSLLDEDDPVRTVPQCLDPDCWARKAAKTGGAAPGNAATSSAPPRMRQPDTSARSAQTGNGSDGNRGGAEPLDDDDGNRCTRKLVKTVPWDCPQDPDYFVAMGALWAFNNLVSGKKLEDLIPAIAGLKWSEVESEGHIADLEQHALPRLSRNRETAQTVLDNLSKRGIW